MVFYWGDPDGPHEHLISCVTESIDAAVASSCRRPLRTCGSETTDLEDGQSVKQPDQSWELTNGSATETVLEVAWGNERTDAFEAEAQVRRWHNAGRNVLGVSQALVGWRKAGPLDSSDSE